MENPHAERQAALLERILKNAVRCLPLFLSAVSDTRLVCVYRDDS